jgi:hypothetical protein
MANFEKLFMIFLALTNFTLMNERKEIVFPRNEQEKSKMTAKLLYNKPNTKMKSKPPKVD